MTSDLPGDGGPADDAESAPRAPAGYGRRVMLLVGAVVVLTTGTVGYVVGTNNAGRVPPVDLFGLGLVPVPTTGPAWAAVGVAVAATGLAVLFGLVELASRLEDRA
jgi:hypothetical protein